MACNSCVSSYFQPADTVIVSFVRSAGSAYLYVQNQGRNAVLIERIILCYTTSTGGGSVLYLRAGTAIAWSWPSTYLETGTTGLFYSLPPLSGGATYTLLQAQAEYVEIDGRSRSCSY